MAHGYQAVHRLPHKREGTLGGTPPGGTEHRVGVRVDGVPDAFKV